MSDDLPPVPIVFVGHPEEERLAQHAIEMLVARASELCEPPEDYMVFAECCSLVLANELNPHGPFPFILELLSPRLIRALRTTFSLPIELDDGRVLDLQICTRAGILQIGQASRLEDVVARHRRLLRYAKPDREGWSEWLCGICPRSWPADGNEPVECPDCGQLLIRIRLPDPEGAAQCHE